MCVYLFSDILYMIFMLLVECMAFMEFKTFMAFMPFMSAASTIAQLAIAARLLAAEVVAEEGFAEGFPPHGQMVPRRNGALATAGALVRRIIC